MLKSCKEVVFHLRQHTIAASKLCTTVKNDDIKPMLTNRNPRNLEKLRIAYKPAGYHLEKPGRCYWHKLELEATGRYVKAWVKHFENGRVVTASTREWPVKSQLYRYNDANAFLNLGRILAQRCMEFGIHEVYSNLQPPESVNNSEERLEKMSKVELFVKALQDGGVQLVEGEQYKKPRPWDLHRPEKPWEVEN